MSNLIITTICNQRCDYCFARDAFKHISPSEVYMPRNVFERALNFLDRSGIDQVRLLGGEPTLHPQFAEMLDNALARGFRVLVFSNGLMPETSLLRLEQGTEGRVAVLINIFDSAGFAPAHRDQRFTTLRRLGPRINLGFNIVTPGVKLDFLLELIDSFDLGRTVRLGITHPFLGGSNRFLHPHYYPEVGRRIAAFAKKAAATDVRIEFDCGLVPCMFPEGTLEAMGKTPEDVGRRCGPTIDILPDGTVISCYPLADIHHESLPENRDARWLRKRFEKALKPYRRLGIFPECKNCSLREQGDCKGGCLAVAGRRLRAVPFQFRLVSPATTIREKRHPAHPRTVRQMTSHGFRTSPGPASRLWVIPYVDQSPAFWERLYERFGDDIKEVYFPLPGGIIGSGRPRQPEEHLDEFLRQSPFSRSVLVNPLTLPQPVEKIAPAIIEALRILVAEDGIAGATVSNLLLAMRIREQLPELPLATSVLMDISKPIQTLMLRGTFETLVPASRIMRDRPALEVLRESFPGRIRLIVNEACLPGCPLRTQHFYEMTSPLIYPRSLCDEILEREPWLRLTGAWILPQHLHLYEGLYDELKLAGRVTLQNESSYIRVLDAYVHRRTLTPDAIGGGPASVHEPIEITEEFFARTLRCGHNCHQCQLCRDYYQKALKRLGLKNNNNRGYKKPRKKEGADEQKIREAKSVRT